MVLLFVIIAVSLGADYFILNKWNQKELKEVPQKKFLIYFSVICVLIIGIGCMLHFFSSDMPDMSATNDINLAVYLVGLSAFAWTDWHKNTIPNIGVLIMLGVRVILWVAELIINTEGFFGVLKDDLIATAIIGGFLFIVHLLMKNSIGMGDLKLIMLMCLYQGLTGVFSSIFLSMLITCVLSIVLLITKKKGRKDTIPFAPYLFLGTFISVAIFGI